MIHIAENECRYQLIVKFLLTFSFVCMFQSSLKPRIQLANCHSGICNCYITVYSFAMQVYLRLFVEQTTCAGYPSVAVLERG